MPKQRSPIVYSVIVTVAVALLSGLAWLFSLREAIAVQGKEIQEIRTQYETRVLLMQTQLDRIETKIDTIQRDLYTDQSQR